MASETKRLEVFQDLMIRGPSERRTELRQALLDHVVAPWLMSEERPKPAGIEGEFLRFQRQVGDGLPEAALVLWSQPEGYKVSNIVPTEFSQLTYAQYNAVLQDFVQRIAEPAAREVDFEVKTTPSHQSIEDWLSPAAAKALRTFSVCANKSSGSTHPADRERWFQFLIQAHKSAGQLSTSNLDRWLIEVEGWSEDIAHRLVIQYEFGLDLLSEYDSRRF
ncbi:hypothetical protein SAMN05519103_01927 [Rhizobiales bacterium GAS113]|nr:hypothetical protein SAMN05519103_01927 [Rhizobiales bacterium GAS113]